MVSVTETKKYKKYICAACPNNLIPKVADTLQHVGENRTCTHIPQEQNIEGSLPRASTTIDSIQSVKWNGKTKYSKNSSKNS